MKKSIEDIMYELVSLIIDRAEETIETPCCEEYKEGCEVNCSDSYDCKKEREYRSKLEDLKNDINNLA